MSLKKLTTLVAEVKELYQPIYGYEKDFAYSRDSINRLKDLEEICSKLQTKLNRKLNILDVGCAQGFFSFNLAKYCKKVDAIDINQENINLCNILQKSNKIDNISFTCESIFEKDINKEYDVILFLNVLHHVCDQNSFEYVSRNLQLEVNKHKVFVIELANQNEDCHWSKSLPKEDKFFLSLFHFYDRYKTYSTHVSSKRRGLYICSNEYIFCDDTFIKLDFYFNRSHDYQRGLKSPNVSYFRSKNYFIKQFRLFENPDLDYKTLLKEKALNSINLFSNNETEAYPLLFNNENSSYLFREFKNGILLYEYLKQISNSDIEKILIKIIDKLVQLESKKFYHNDLRLWNIVVCENNDIEFIDLCSISNSTKDCLGYDVFFSFLIFISEMYNLEFLEFPFRLLPEFRNLNDNYITIYNYVLLNPNKVSFTAIKEILISSKYTDNSMIMNLNTCFNEINKNLLNYYHHNQFKIEELDYFTNNYHHLNGEIAAQTKRYEELKKTESNLLNKLELQNGEIAAQTKRYEELKKTESNLLKKLELQKIDSQNNRNILLNKFKISLIINILLCLLSFSLILFYVIY